MTTAQMDSIADLPLAERHAIVRQWLEDLTTIYEMCAAERDTLKRALEALLASYENYSSEHKPEAEWDEYDMLMFPRWQAARQALAVRRPE